MGSKTTFLSPVSSDAAVVSASDAINGAPAVNVQDQRPTLYWQSTTTTPFLIFDFTNVRNVPVPNALFLGYLNLGGSNQSRTVRVVRGTTKNNVISGPNWDSGVFSVENNGLVNYARPHLLYKFTPGGSGNFWAVRFDWSLTADLFVRLARAVLGVALIPVNSADPGWSIDDDESVVEMEDIGSGLSTRPRGARRSLKFGWANGSLTVDEGAALDEMMLERGSARDLVCCVDTTETAHPMSVLVCGRMKTQFSMKHVPVAYRSTSLVIEELGITEMMR